MPHQQPLIHVSSAQLQMQDMANDYVRLTIQTQQALDLTIGDYIPIRNRRYSLRTTPETTINSAHQIQQVITLYGPMYDLKRYIFRNTDVNLLDDDDEFDLTFNLNDFIKVVINNIHRAGDHTWVYDQASTPTTDPQTITFSAQNCLSALQTITQTFDVAFRITQQDNIKTLHIGKDLGINLNPDSPLYYGPHGGITQLQESKINDDTTINRLYPQGGTENIIHPYRETANRLQLPLRRHSIYQHTLTDGTTIPIGTVIGIPDDCHRYIDEQLLHENDNSYTPDNLIQQQGILESAQHFDDIYPTRTYQITQRNSRLTFTSDIDFDLTALYADTLSEFQEYCILRNLDIPTDSQYSTAQQYYNSAVDHYTDYLTYLARENQTPEQTTFSLYLIRQGIRISRPVNANDTILHHYYQYKQFIGKKKYIIDNTSIVFIDGRLAGQTFTLNNYNHTSHQITINPYTESDTGTEMPSPETDYQAFRTAVGDHFKVTNIRPPLSYIQEAEERLWFKALEHFETYKYPSYRYTLNIDPIYVHHRYQQSAINSQSEASHPLFSIMQPADLLTITDPRLPIPTITVPIQTIDIDLLHGHNPCISYRITLDAIRKNHTRTNRSLAQQTSVNTFHEPTTVRSFTLTERLRRQLQNTTTTLQDINQTTRSLHEQLQDAVQIIKINTDTQEQQATDISSISARITDNENQYSTIQADISQINLSLSDTRDVIQQTSNTTSNLEERITDLEGRIEALERNTQ